MTLEELKSNCEKAGFKYAYGVFKNPVEPPHLLAFSTDTDNFGADNKVYYKKTPIQLDYTYINKNLEEQNKIENIILKDIYWNKSEENSLPDEKIWQVSYFFEI